MLKPKQYARLSNEVKYKQETWKFFENQVFQLLHETRKTFQVHSTELMYFSLNNIYI